MAGKGDLAIVQYALTLEHLDTDFYNAVLDSGVVKNRQLGETGQRGIEHARRNRGEPPSQLLRVDDSPHASPRWQPPLAPA